MTQFGAAPRKQARRYRIARLYRELEQHHADYRALRGRFDESEPLVQAKIMAFKDCLRSYERACDEEARS